MAFRVPAKFRVRKGNLASDDSFKNNGMFLIPAGEELAPDNQGRLTKVPYFIICTASDQNGWDHVAVVIHTIAAPRGPVGDELKAIRNMFWDDIKDTVISYYPSDKYKDENPLCAHLWRKQGFDMPFPEPSLYGLEKKGLITLAKSIIKGQ